MNTQTTAPIKTATSKLASILQHECKRSPVSAAVFLTFAMRERARQQVTIANLQQVMKANKFDFSKEELSEVLTFLAVNGIGRIVKNRASRVMALVDVKFTLQSIGQVAMGTEAKIENFKPQTKFVKITTPSSTDAPPTQEQIVKHSRRATDLAPGLGGHKVTVSANIGGKELILGDMLLTSDQIAKLLVDMKKESQT